jgi:hypothetical protein
MGLCFSKCPQCSTVEIPALDPLDHDIYNPYLFEPVRSPANTKRPSPRYTEYLISTEEVT